MTKPIYTIDFAEIARSDTPNVGSKNAKLGEPFKSLRSEGVGILEGFATTTDAYRSFLLEHDLEYKLVSLLSDLETDDPGKLAIRGHAARAAARETPLPDDLANAILTAYDRLCRALGRAPEMAVRASTISTDQAEFTEVGKTILHVRGREALLRAVHQCFVSLFTDEAIEHRARLGYDPVEIQFSVGVQPMVRSKVGSSTVKFTCRQAENAEGVQPELQPKPASGAKSPTRAKAKYVGSGRLI